MLDELEWPSLGDRRVKSSLTFFYKIHSGTECLDTDRYLTPAPNLRNTRASHHLQCTRYMAYSDALKNYIFPRTILLWNSLPSSMVSSKTAEEFKAHICVVMIYVVSHLLYGLKEYPFLLDLRVSYTSVDKACRSIYE